MNLSYNKNTNNSQHTNVNCLKINDLLNYEHNSLCGDCKSKCSEYANTLFGVFICSDCVNNHNKYFPQLKSYIHSLNTYTWSDYEICLLKVSGNNKINDYLKDYNVKDNELNLNKKYLIKAILYYVKTMQYASASKEYNKKKLEFKEGTKEISIEKLITNNEIDLNKDNLVNCHKQENGVISDAVCYVSDKIKGNEEDSSTHVKYQ